MRLVGLTAGLVKPRTLTWKGNSRNAPETPAGAVRAETAKATSSGRRGLTSTPETGEWTIRASYAILQATANAPGFCLPHSRNGSQGVIFESPFRMVSRRCTVKSGARNLHISLRYSSDE